MDAWIAACLELHAVTASLAERSRAREALERAAAADNRHDYIAPTEELRQWSRRLVGRGFSPPRDELPTVVLPQRVLSRWLPGLAIPDLTPEDGHLALACERAAAVRGMTLETWALTALLADRGY